MAFLERGQHLLCTNRYDNTVFLLDLDNQHDTPASEGTTSTSTSTLNDTWLHQGWI